MEDGEVLLLSNSKHSLQVGHRDADDERLRATTEEAVMAISDGIQHLPGNLISCLRFKVNILSPKTTELLE